jgi:hypothetical protein
MSRQVHPLLPEELMAYIDGELAADRAAMAAKHIETCAECELAVADAMRVSREMAQWKVPEPSEDLERAVMAEAGRAPKATRRTGSSSTWFGTRNVWIYGAAGSLAALLVFGVAIPSLLRSRQDFDESGAVGNMRTVTVAETDDAVAPMGEKLSGTILTPSEIEIPTKRATVELAPEMPQEPQSNAPIPAAAGPMIVRTVSLSLMTNEFDKARTAVDTIAREANGYVEQLNVRGEIGSGRGLSVTLRVPADKLDSSLAALRKLGHVENESQNSSDVSAQFVDMEARLKNARNTEQRFLALLRERTGNLKDVVEAEREIARVREEIERMDAQLKGLSKRISYATIQVSLQEEFHANLDRKLPSTGTRLGNAAVNGYKLAVETVVGFLMAILLYGPTLVLVALAVALIAFLAWRIQKRRIAKQA